MRLRFRIAYPNCYSQFREWMNYSELDYDRLKKAPAYARAGILDYWILDVNLYQIYRFCQPQAGTYRQEQRLNEGATISLIAFPDIPIEVARLFP